MANSFPGSGLTYVDQLAVGRSSGTSLINSYLADDLNTIQIRAESNTSGVVSYTGIAPAYLEYYRNITTGVDLTIQTKIQAAGGGGNIVFSPNSPSADLTPVERMRITKAGSVGIGTTSPTYKLDIGGSGPSFGMSNTSATGYNEMYFSRNTSTVVGYIGVGVNAAVTANGDDFVIQNRLSTGNLVLHTNTTERMRIASNGYVGMGTSSPADKLHVIGADNGITICSSSANRPVFSLYNGSSLMLKLSANGVYGAIADNSGSDVMYFKGGCVSIGTSSPSYKLHVNGTFYSAGSSVDYKQGICNYNTDSCMFMKLKPVTYQYKEEYCHLGKELKSGTQIGLIAEEVAESHPELAILVNEEDNKVVRNVDYEKLSIILLSELQKLRQEVDQLKNK